MTTRSSKWGDFGSVVVLDTGLLFVLIFVESTAGPLDSGDDGGNPWSGDGDRRIEVDILDGMDEGGTLLGGALE